MEGYREDKEVEEIFRALSPSIKKAQVKALQDVLSKASSFVSYEDLTRYIILKLEGVKLTEKDKAGLLDVLEKIYKKAQQEEPLKHELPAPDARTIRYAEKLHDFYLGGFFSGDKDLRLEVSKWFSNYYIYNGSPIGKGQKGISEFLDKFGDYLSNRTEAKARQIIDTSVNFLRNSARLKALQNAKIEQYRWDATNDRLTCHACRSMDGRIFDTSDAIRVIDMLESSGDPTLIKEVKPIQTSVQVGSSKKLLNKFPPLHPLCRCRVHAYIDEVRIPATVERPVFAKDTPAQRELEEFYRTLTPQEISERIKAHQGASWFRPVKGGKGVNAYEKAKKDAERHFYKHGDEFGYKTAEEYCENAIDIIKNPDEVYVEKVSKGIFYIFRKDDKIVVSNDDALAIKSFYRLDPKKSFEQKLKGEKRDGIIKIK